MIDDDFRTAFVTADPQKIEEARKLLAEAFGHDRVSVTRWAETPLDEYKKAVDLWRRDPRINSRGS
jgi:hypothetical protein